MAEEFGWVIEHGTSPVHEPSYWTGGDWSKDHLRAIRFARKIDGERIVLYAMEPEVHPHRVCEHGWG